MSDISIHTKISGEIVEVLKANADERISAAQSQADAAMAKANEAMAAIPDTVPKANQLTTARTISISGGATGTATSFNGASNITIPVTSLDASKLTGTAPINTSGNAATASKLATARSIALSGGATGTATAFDGSGNITIPVTSLDASKLTGTASVNTTGKANTAGVADSAKTCTGNAATATSISSNVVNLSNGTAFWVG